MQPRIPPLRSVIPHRDGQCLLLPDQHDWLLPAREPRMVKKLERLEMAWLKGFFTDIRYNFGTLGSGNFDGFRCKRHQQKHLVFSQPALQAGGRGFESRHVHQLYFFQRNSFDVVSAYHLLFQAGGQHFESRLTSSI